MKARSSLGFYRLLPVFFGLIVGVSITLAVGCVGITEWIGHPVLSDNDPYRPIEYWLPGYRIGFRADGVVVWEKVVDETTFTTTNVMAPSSNLWTTLTNRVHE